MLCKLGVESQVHLDERISRTSDSNIDIIVIHVIEVAFVRSGDFEDTIKGLKRVPLDEHIRVNQIIGLQVIKRVQIQELPQRLIEVLDIEVLIDEEYI